MRSRCGPHEAPCTTTGPRAAQDPGGPSIVKVLLRLIPDMLIRELVLLCSRGEGQSFHNQFDIVKSKNHFVFYQRFGCRADESILTCSNMLNAKDHLV